jgi:hypothetical protein
MVSLITDASGRPICTIFKGQEVKETWAAGPFKMGLIGRHETSITKLCIVKLYQQYELHNNCKNVLIKSLHIAYFWNSF